MQFVIGTLLQFRISNFDAFLNQLTLNLRLNLNNFVLFVTNLDVNQCYHILGDLVFLATIYLAYFVTFFLSSVVFVDLGLLLLRLALDHLYDLFLL